ncbi:GNAT family N-acetyltransferase [Culicoidibacter larvae]|uniref:GNAT family N-acetyltransferase n=1 Tax=Culicoidibacter larvae TaxID=2579976 RepID=A0A5R8QF50_9FIRM|nr:GNAT family N-acetyltransferase [Culicoidibacter larvae]TLG76635.1 GNAT family N-acetyltransferase [Culicoidibacter larvae]
MIRMATKDDEQILYDFWLKELDYNTFNIGDLAAFGTENHDLQTIWMQLDQGRIMATVLLYKDNIVLYFPKENTEFVDYDGFAACLAGRNGKNISAMDYVWQGFKPFMQTDTMKEIPTYLCVLDVEQAKTQNADSVQLADGKVVGDIFAMQLEIFGTQRKEQDYQQFQDDIAAENVYCAVIYQDEKLVSQATITAISPYSAMVVGVATDVEYRQKGYARATLSKLVAVAKQRKLQSLVLFYDNPNAGALYHDVGFNTIGQWIMVEL